MIWLILGLVLLLAISLPGIWVRQVLSKYSEPADRYRSEGTGSELARHLLDQCDLPHVKVEETELGDHYDPQAQAVRLSPDKFNGHSLTAVTVAAHEVGHAIQHDRGESMFDYRQRLVRVAVVGERMGSMLLLAAPVIMLLTRLPQAGFMALLIAVGTMGLGSLVHLLTLPVELDASFNKALPILDGGDYLHPGDLPHARKILKAAALTYVAASLASLLNLGRWLAVLRR
jgi:Zn-dependent membrane protease YugP